MRVFTDLSEFGDESFDAVLCLGPLSHILEEDDRDRAVRELIRVAKKGAPLIVSVISLYGVYMVVLKKLTDELLNPSHEEMFTHGIHRARWHLGDFSGQGFTDAKFYHPNEIKDLFEGHGVETIEMATCEGLSCQTRGRNEQHIRRRGEMGAVAGHPPQDLQRPRNPRPQRPLHLH